MDNEQVAAKARPEIMADLLVGIEEPGVDGGVLVHGDRVARLRRVPATEPRRGHEDRLQRIAPSIRGELALFDARLEAAPRGHDPHLDETHRLGLRAVALRVLHARAERRALDRAGMKDAAVATRVGVLEGPLGDVGDPLDVSMRMHRPGRTRHEAIVVEDPKISDPHVRLIPILIEAEVPVRAEPATISVEQRCTRTKDDGHRARAGLGRGGSGDVWLKLLEELIFGVVADNAISFTTVLEEDHRRDRADAETAGGDGIGVDIQLRDLHLFALLVCDFFEYRSDHPTRATPGRPEIYEDRSVRFNDLRLEVLVADYLWLGHGAPPITT